MKPETAQERIAAGVVGCILRAELDKPKPTETELDRRAQSFAHQAPTPQSGCQVETEVTPSVAPRDGMDGHLANCTVLVLENQGPAQPGTGVVSFENASDMRFCNFDGCVRRVVACAGHGGMRKDLEQSIRMSDSQRLEDQTFGFETRQWVKQLVEL